MTYKQVSDLIIVVLPSYRNSEKKNNMPVAIVKRKRCNNTRKKIVRVLESND